MMTNGLSETSGTVVDAAQTIHLTFNFRSTGISSLMRLSRDTGQVATVPLLHDGGSLYHLDLTLDGGTGDLFKYNNGIPFVVLSGDFDGDHDVDGQDFLRWQRGQSPNSLSASDLEAWKQHFGEGAVTASSLPVPEPSAFFLALLAVGYSNRFGRRSAD